MGLLNIYDRIMDARRGRQVEGILGQAATGNASQYGPVQPQQGTGLLGGQISPLVAATRIQEVGGNTYDPVARQVMGNQTQMNRQQYDAMMQQVQNQQNNQRKPNAQKVYEWIKSTLGDKAAEEHLMRSGSETNIYTGDLPGNTKQTTNKLQANQLDTMGQLAGLNEIRALYKPEFQQFETQASQWWTGLKDKLGQASPEEQASLSEYTKFRAASSAAQNERIHAMSGGAVTPAEATRLTKEVPSVGNFPGDGDSPTEFKAKTERINGSLRNALIRQDIALRMGLDWKSIPLTTQSVNRYIDRYGAQLEADFKRQNMSQKQAEDAAYEQLKAIGYIE